MTDPIRGEFELKRLWLAIASKNYEMAKSAAMECEQSFKAGTNNWFIAKEYEFFLLMHTKQWQQAAEFHKLIVNHQRFPSQPEQVQQKWILFGYYAALVSTAQTSSIPSTQKRAFNKILREVPIYKKDKAGYNASLYILQYLILASHRDYDGLVAKSEGIAKYINRYLRGRTDTQLYGFLKTLLALKKYDFDVLKTRKRAKKYIEQFNRFGREKVDETQTLPYSMMWAWILEWIKPFAEMRKAQKLLLLQQITSPTPIKSPRREPSTQEGLKIS